MRIGECLIALGRPVESTEAFARSFERAPHSLVATLGIANLYASHGEPRGALPFIARHLAHPLGLASHHASSLRARGVQLPPRSHPSGGSGGEGGEGGEGGGGGEGDGRGSSGGGYDDAMAVAALIDDRADVRLAVIAGIALAASGAHDDAVR
jgi:hypothetical protein